LGRNPYFSTRCFTFAESGEFFGHLLDGHIIHLLSRHLSHNIEKDPVEINLLGFWLGIGIPLDTLQGQDIGR